uniref:SIR2-like domain-containing protein n=1 Tax=Phenylobacterium glaciei TaxID=2803784 RepID=A0A974P4M5_9CAUL|nr:hypothetical protein JKL49_08330 [Phenylobacterium glaciei]
MLSGSTVLVLGAGSSVDFGMPVGSELAKDIRDRLAFHFDFGTVLKGDEILAMQFQRAFGDRSPSAFAAAQRLASVIGSFKSIDDCLYTHGADELMMTVGKAAIVRAIAAKEHSSWLRKLWSGQADARAQALAKLDSGWVHQIVQMLVTGRRAADRRDLFSDLSLVTFNYDRCAETALFHLVRQAYAIEDVEAVPIMEGLKVYRPYGGLAHSRGCRHRTRPSVQNTLTHLEWRRASRSTLKSWASALTSSKCRASCRPQATSCF